MKQICLYSSVALTLMLAPMTAHAGHMTYEGTLTEDMSWNSNPMMIATNIEALYGSSTIADFKIGNTTPLWNLDIKGRVTQNIFNQSEFNSTDLSGGIDLKRIGPNWQAQLKSHVSKETTRTSELTTFGQTANVTDRFRYNLAPEFNITLSKNFAFDLKSTYAETKYNDASLTDHTTFNIKPAFLYLYNKDWTGELAIKYGQYHADNAVQTRIESFAPTIGLLFDISPRLNGWVRGGVNASKERNSSLPTQKWKRGIVYEAGLGYTGEQTDARVLVINEQQPYSNGSETLLTSFTLDGSHKINKVLQVNAKATYQDAGSSSSSTLNHKIKGHAGLKYQFLSDMAVNMSYEYRAEKYNNGTANTHSNSAMIKLIWTPFSK